MGLGQAGHAGSAMPAQARGLWDKTKIPPSSMQPWVGWRLLRGAGVLALLTFVEESHAGASLGLPQRQRLCDHLCQTAGQLGVKGQRGGCGQGRYWE